MEADKLIRHSEAPPTSSLIKKQASQPTWLSNPRFRTLLSDGFILAFVLGGTVTMFLPIFWMVISGFKSLPEVRSIPPQLFPEVWLWQNYVDVWKVTPLARAFVNSMFIGFAQVVGVVISSTFAAYAFAKLRFPGRDLMFVMILSTLMVPFFLQAIPLFVIVAKLGWINSYQAQIVPFLASGFGIFLMRQFMLTIPGELIDAARIDGCSEFGILWRIVLPLVKTAAAALSIFVFIFSWQDLFWPLLVAKQADYFPIQQAIYFIRGQYSANEHLLMAAGTLAILPPLIMFLILQERMVQGVTLTGLKG